MRQRYTEKKKARGSWDWVRNLREQRPETFKEKIHTYDLFCYSKMLECQAC